MSSLKDLKSFSDSLPTQYRTMPMLFVGHGNPMNAIEDNEFSRGWSAIGKELPTPRAILCISAHWETKGTFVTAAEKPQTIHDFFGFPDELFAVQYPAAGSPELAKQTKEIIRKAAVEPDTKWGLDHGCWSVVKHMYPNADVPIIELSIDYTKPAGWHYELANDLATLREKGILIIGSGNMVHNLRVVDWENPDGAYDWAAESNERFKKFIADNDHERLIHYDGLGKAAALAIPTPEHFLPMLYVLGLRKKQEEVRFFNDKLLMGSISMTSFKVVEP
jgi:4,5-DOPA dioxygenase extradiol